MKHKLNLIIGAALAMPALLQAATVNVGTVALNANTGQYLTSTGAINTAGFIQVGFFNKTFAELQNTINGWSASSTALAAYESLNNSFTAIGTVINPATSGTLGGYYNRIVPNSWYWFELQFRGWGFRNSELG